VHWACDTAWFDIACIRYLALDYLKGRLRHNEYFLALLEDWQIALLFILHHLRAPAIKTHCLPALLSYPLVGSHVLGIQKRCCKEPLRSDTVNRWENPQNAVSALQKTLGFAQLHSYPLYGLSVPTTFRESTAKLTPLVLHAVPRPIRGGEGDRPDTEPHFFEEFTVWYHYRENHFHSLPASVLAVGGKDVDGRLEDRSSISTPVQFTRELCG
jgi:hypothetical protein